MNFILIAILALSSFSSAHAQDKGKTDFTHTAEFRLRDTLEQNESGSNANVQPHYNHHNGIDQRFKLGLGFKANEKLSASATLLQAASFGQGPSESLGDRGTTTGNSSQDETNFLSVNEAYATWMVSEDLLLKFGRMNFTFGDGSVMAVNDYEVQPYSFDGVTARYEFAFGRFTAFAFKYRDYTKPAADGTVLHSVTSDPQHDAYGLDFELKRIPEWLKMVNVNLIQDVADSVTSTNNGAAVSANTVGGLENQKLLRYGAVLGAEYGVFDFKVDYQGVNGKNSDYNNAGPTNPRTVNSMMYQAEAGFNMPAYLMGRIYVNYHKDSGTSATDAAGSKYNTYDAYFYEKHGAAGLMDLVGWGNLTDLSIGYTIRPTDATLLGVDFHALSKTASDDAITAGTYGQYLIANTACGGATGVACDTKIGNEVDVFAEHHYEGGLMMLARLGVFTPGAQLEESGIDKSLNVFQFMVQGRLVF